jgi:hypothetical protein
MAKRRKKAMRDRKGSTPGYLSLADRGCLLVGASVLWLAAIWIARSEGSVEGLGAVRAVLVMVARLLSMPLYVLFGKADFLFPILLMALGISYFWRVHHVRRQRIAVQGSIFVAVVSVVLALLGGLWGGEIALGGAVGGLPVRYLVAALGKPLGLLASVALVATLISFLWKREPLAWASAGGRGFVAAKDAFLNLQKRTPAIAQLPDVSAAQVHLGPVSEKGNPQDRKSGVPEDWNPNFSGQWSEGPSVVPWAVNPPTEDEVDDETSFRPLPLPERDEPLPIDILPDPVSSTKDLASVEAMLPDLQALIVSVVKRTTSLVLVPVRMPQIGLNTISFEFKKEDGQRVSVRKVEQAGEDVGVESSRAPVLVSLGQTIRFDVPLLPEERRFAPIKPLLLETMGAAQDRKVRFLFGRRQDGTPFEMEVGKARNVLVGGETGGGKTVMLHQIILGIIFKYSPSEVRLVLCDHKILEFSRYRGAPHLWQGIVTSPRGFSRMVENLKEEQQRRKKILAADPTAVLPCLVVVADELSGFDTNPLVNIIAEARALNMSLLLATQHPLATVVSTAVKANCVTSIAFRTRSAGGSNLIIGCPDAVSLKDRGDCLVNTPSGLERIQAGWVTKPEEMPNSDLEAVVGYLRSSHHAG